MANYAIFAKLYPPIAKVSLLLIILDEFAKLSSTKQIYLQTLVLAIFIHSSQRRLGMLFHKNHFVISCHIYFSKPSVFKKFSLLTRILYCPYESREVSWLRCLFDLHITRLSVLGHLLWGQIQCRSWRMLYWQWRAALIRSWTTSFPLLCSTRWWVAGVLSHPGDLAKGCTLSYTPMYWTDITGSTLPLLVITVILILACLPYMAQPIHHRYAIYGMYCGTVFHINFVISLFSFCICVFHCCFLRHNNHILCAD